MYKITFITAGSPYEEEINYLNQIESKNISYNLQPLGGAAHYLPSDRARVIIIIHVYQA